MTHSAISSLRLTNQHIQGTQFTSVQELVHWMGAVQSQDYAMAQYAIGVRIKNSTHRMIEEAIDKAEIIRTHILRPTWHFVSAKDARWMMELTAKNLNRALASNNRRLELDEKTFKKCNGIIEKLLYGGKHLTRKEIMSVLEKKGIRTNDLRASHIMFRAETSLVVCNGIKREKQFTYALFDERVPATKKRTREEALAGLALTYFLSHGPASLPDFTWWSGLSASDAREGLELVKGKLVSEKSRDKIYWFSPDSSFTKNKTNFLVFLPAFDEFIISYKSREVCLDPQFASHAFTNNGIFNPIIVHNAKVIGIWKPQYQKGVKIKQHFFGKPSATQQRLCLKATRQFERFMLKE